MRVLRAIAPGTTCPGAGPGVDLGASLLGGTLGYPVTDEQEPMRYAQMVLDLEDTLCARHRLDAREVQFVQAWVQGQFPHGGKAKITQGEAARQAGYCGPRATDRSLRVAGARVFNRPRVKAAIAEYTRFVSDGLTEEMVRGALVTALRQALGQEPVKRSRTSWAADGEPLVHHELLFVGDPSTIKGIAEVIAKIRGMFTERLQIGGLTHEQALDVLDNDSL